MNPALPRLLVCLLLIAPIAARAETALVAVAANFTDAAASLVASFESSTGHRIRLSSGSTGKLYAQISKGAPFDAFLAADQHRPQLLEASPHGVPGTRFTYARGRLVIWIPAAADDSVDLLAELRNARHIAIANPELAPYGAAATAALDHLTLAQELENRIVRGENVAQAFAMVASGNAQAGFVARSLVAGGNLSGFVWRIPCHWHQPIRQDALLLRHGAGNAAARDFLAYLRSEPTQRLIETLGYDGAADA